MNWQRGIFAFWAGISLSLGAASDCKYLLFRLSNLPAEATGTDVDMHEAVGTDVLGGLESTALRESKRSWPYGSRASRPSARSHLFALSRTWWAFTRVGFSEINNKRPSVLIQSRSIPKSRRAWGRRWETFHFRH
jgi:hypothetical protein